MLRVLHGLLALLGVAICYAQKTDTLRLFYQSDEFIISKKDKLRIDNFLSQGWDKLAIKSYTDDEDEDEYNVELSKKRAGGVYNYFMAKNMAANLVSREHYGENMPPADNTTDEGRAFNRQTTIIGYRYPRVQRKTIPPTDIMKPVTTALDNGFIITYRPGSLSETMRDNFEAGYGMDFQLVTNTTEMRQANLFNNTTNGEILSSVIIFCGQRLNPCKLDTPVLIKVPIPFETKCPIQKVKFFNAVAERGKMIWQEESKSLYPEVINGRQYISIWMDNFCECINFDFKVDPDCFDVDSTKLLLVNTKIKNLTTELIGLNSVYMPRQTAEAEHSIVFLKGKINEALISFSLYNGKKRIKGFRNRQLKEFPYNETTGSYVLSTDTIKFYFPKTKEADIVLKVNGDRYISFLDKNKCELIYLNRKKEDITVDISVWGKKGRTTQYKNQSLASIPYDAAKGHYVVDKQFLKTLELKNSLSLK
jgi:hypothetical protein